jgi:hypothetical protein
MLVRKINPEWKPIENPNLKVGETIEKTNPRQLILEGNAEAVDKDGNSISSYELYGVISKDERKDFEEYLKVKKLEATKLSLEKEAAALKAQLNSEKDKTATEIATNGEAKTVTELTYQELVKKAQEKGVWKVGMKKEELKKLVS